MADTPGKGCSRSMRHTHISTIRARPSSSVAACRRWTTPGRPRILSCRYAASCTLNPLPPFPLPGISRSLCHIRRRMPRCHVHFPALPPFPARTHCRRRPCALHTQTAACDFPLQTDRCPGRSRSGLPFAFSPLSSASPASFSRCYPASFSAAWVSVHHQTAFSRALPCLRSPRPSVPSRTASTLPVSPILLVSSCWRSP